MTDVTKFHGMKVIANSDLNSAMGNDVIEMNSNGNLVCLYYDVKGNAKDKPIVINLSELFFRPIPVTEASITSFIKRQIGRKTVLISESAVEEVKRFVSTF